MNSPTAWQAGRLDASRGRQRLLFGAMYEDAEIEHAAFQGKDRVFCIASAGSTAVRLSAQHEVVACDINPAQLAYAERRAAGEPVERGDAERAMNFARVFIPLVGWTTGTVRAFLGFSDVSEQTAYWRKHLDTLASARRSTHCSLRPSCVLSMHRNSSLPCRRDSARCCGNDWKRDSPGIRMLRTPTRGRSSSAKTVRRLNQ